MRTLEKLRAWATRKKKSHEASVGLGNAKKKRSNAMNNYEQLSAAVTFIFECTKDVMTVLFTFVIVLLILLMFHYGINYCFKLIVGNKTDSNDYEE
jgi:hypothetical protein